MPPDPHLEMGPGQSQTWSPGEIHKLQCPAWLKKACRERRKGATCPYGKVGGLWKKGRWVDGVNRSVNAT